MWSHYTSQNDRPLVVLGLSSEQYVSLDIKAYFDSAKIGRAIGSDENFRYCAGGRNHFDSEKLIETTFRSRRGCSTLKLVN